MKVKVKVKVKRQYDHSFKLRTLKSIKRENMHDYMPLFATCL